MRRVTSMRFERRPNNAMQRSARNMGSPEFGVLVARPLTRDVRPHIQFRNSHPEERTMTKYLISFPGSAMDISDEDMAAVGEAAHAVIREAKDAGVYVFGGGI